MKNRKNTIEQILTSFHSIRNKVMSESQQLWQSCHPTPAQGYVLFLLKKNNQLTLTELSKKLETTLSAATQLVNGLVKSNYVIKETDINDKRITIIKLSEQFGKQVGEMKKKNLQKFSSLFETLSDAELENLEIIFNKIVNNYKKEDT